METQVKKNINTKLEIKRTTQKLRKMMDRLTVHRQRIEESRRGGLKVEVVKCTEGVQGNNVRADKTLKRPGRLCDSIQDDRGKGGNRS